MGTAYGLVTSMQNLNLTVSPVIFGAIHDTTTDNRGGYFWSGAFVMFQALIAYISLSQLISWIIRTAMF